MTVDAFTYEFMGTAIQHEQLKFYNKIASRSIPFVEALQEHKVFNVKQRAVLTRVSIELNIFMMAASITAAVYVYDFFVMPWGMWVHILTFIFFTLMVVFVLPSNWAPVNDNQDNLRLLVAESVGEIKSEEDYEDKDERGRIRDAKKGIKDMDGKTSGEESNIRTTRSGEGYGGELWDASKRAQFLIHLQNTEFKCNVFGVSIGTAFIMEMFWLYASLAFLMWQVTVLSGWKGFSFDHDHE